MSIRAMIMLSLGNQNKIVIDKDGIIEGMVSVNGDDNANKIVEEINSGKFDSVETAIDWCKKANRLNKGG